MTDFLRPQARAFLTRWREVAGTLALALAGVWLFALGGWFYQGVGLLVGLAALLGAVIAVRRVRFQREVDQPGVVEIDEGQVRYFGPHGGGFAAIRELVEVELLTDTAQQRWWRLSEAGGNVLSIPIAATGADQLFDAFSSLPGLSQARLLQAMDGPVDRPITVWRREARRALT